MIYCIVDFRPFLRPIFLGFLVYKLVKMSKRSRIKDKAFTYYFQSIDLFLNTDFPYIPILPLTELVKKLNS